MWRERRKLVGMWREGRAAALATLVAVEGSSYRRPGARLMVSADGESAGSISGGCLEAEIVRKARWLVREGARVERYSMALDDTSDLPYGLGCGGAAEVLLEPAGTPEFDALLRALAASLEGEAAEVYTELPGGGQRFSRVVRAAVPGDSAAVPGNSAAGAALSARAHVERIDAAPRLLVCGAGDDAQPLVSMASLLGWRVVVLDGRAHLARPERFPEAERVSVVDPGSALPLEVAPTDSAVVMTHSYEQDRAWLRLLLAKRLPSVGLLGARHRGALLAGEVAALLRWPLAEVCAKVCTPVGLDLGGDGAEAIALAIVAEMQARAAGRTALSRRLEVAVVAEQIANDANPSRYQTQCAL